MKKKISIEKVKKGYLIEIKGHTRLFKNWLEVVGFLTGYFGLLAANLVKKS